MHFFFFWKETLVNEYTDMFRGMDTNMDGYITKDDLKYSWKKEGVDLKKKTIKKILKTFDVNFDKKISLNGKISKLYNISNY